MRKLLKRGSHGSYGGSHWDQQSNDDSNNDTNCYYCGKHGHIAKNYYQKEHDAWNGKL